jgi:hypothetical protein
MNLHLHAKTGGASDPGMQRRVEPRRHEGHEGAEKSWAGGVRIGMAHYFLWADTVRSAAALVLDPSPGRAAYQVLADLILAGWRPTAEPSPDSRI